MKNKIIFNPLLRAVRVVLVAVFMPFYLLMQFVTELFGSVTGSADNSFIKTIKIDVKALPNAYKDELNSMWKGNGRIFHKN